MFGAKFCGASFRISRTAIMQIQLHRHLEAVHRSPINNSSLSDQAGKNCDSAKLYNSESPRSTKLLKKIKNKIKYQTLFRHFIITSLISSYELLFFTIVYSRKLIFHLEYIKRSLFMRLNEKTPGPNWLNSVALRYRSWVFARSDGHSPMMSVSFVSTRLETRETVHSVNTRCGVITQRCLRIS